MKSKVSYIVVMVLLTSLVSVNAMDPLPEKLSVLKTSLETLQQKMETLRDKLEDLRDELQSEEYSADEEGEEYAQEGPTLLEKAWEWFAQKEALCQQEEQRREQERQATEKGLIEKISESLTSYAYNTAAAWFGGGSTIHIEGAGEPIDIYTERKPNPDIPGSTSSREKVGSYRPPLNVPADSPPPIPKTPGVSFDTKIGGVNSDSIPRKPQSRYSAQQRSDFSTMWARDFANFFQPMFDPYAVDNTDAECKILDNYELYVYPEFLTYARSLSSYDQYMLALQRKIETDKKFRKKTFKMFNFPYNTVPGFTYSGFHDFVKNETHTIKNKIIEEQCSREGVLNLNDSVALGKLAEAYKQASRLIDQKDPDKKRLNDRLAVLNEVNRKGGMRIDYSGKVKKHPTFTDPYANVFDHRCGTILDMELHKDLCDTRVMMLYLQDKYASNTIIQSYGPIIDRITALAKKEQDVKKAFNYADFAYDVVGIVSSSVFEVVKTTLDPRTYVNAAVGILELGVFLAQGGEPLDEFDIATHVAMFPEDKDTLFTVSEEYQQRCQEQAQAAQEVYEQLKAKYDAMTWEEKAQVGVKTVTELGLFLLMPRMPKWAGIPARCKFLSDWAKVIKSTRAKEAMAGVGAIEKIVVEEGAEVAQIAIEVLKKNPRMFRKKGKAAIQTAKNMANERGRTYEEFLVKKFGGRGSFKVKGKLAGTREFDGAIGNLWYEAKSGEFWNALVSNDEIRSKFQSDMIKGLTIAREHGATYELYSNTPIPPKIKDWLTKKNIPFSEIPFHGGK